MSAGYYDYVEQTISGTLPPNFNQWQLATKRGWTVAHVAAKYGHLPADFDQWGLVDNGGLTVLRLLLLSIAESSDKHTTRWGKERPLCKTSEDWEVFKKELPEIYMKYTIVTFIETQSLIIMVRG
jgi:hypothetical protein